MLEKTKVTVMIEQSRDTSNHNIGEDKQTKDTTRHIILKRRATWIPPKHRG